MERINLYDSMNELKPNEKLLLDEGGCAKTYLCRCKGEYSPEYFYKQKLIVILEGEININVKDKDYTFKKGDFFKLEDNELFRITQSDALVLTIIEEK